MQNPEASKRFDPSAGRLPDFLLIGATKSGTTSLHGYLSLHPKLFWATPKEPQYFSQRFESLEYGISWYHSLFDGAGPDQLCGEASTCYSRWPQFGDVAARIAAEVPKAKLIYIVRHPIDRAYSHYGHIMFQRLERYGEPPMPVDEAFERYPELIDASCYGDQMDRYLEYFPKEQLQVVLFEELLSSTAETLNAVMEFLGIATVALAGSGRVVTNSREQRLAASLARDLAIRLRRAPLASTLIDLLPVRFRREARAKLTSPEVAERLLGRAAGRRIADLPRISEATRKDLGRRFEDPTRRLELSLGRSLPEWRE